MAEVGFNALNDELDEIDSIGKGKEKDQNLMTNLNDSVWTCNGPK